MGSQCQAVSAGQGCSDLAACGLAFVSWRCQPQPHGLDSSSQTVGTVESLTARPCSFGWGRLPKMGLYACRLLYLAAVHPGSLPYAPVSSVSCHLRLRRGVS